MQDNNIQTLETGIAKHRGVVFDKRRNKHIATIKIKGKSKFLGYFERKDFHLAVEARLKAEEIYQKPLKEARQNFVNKIVDGYVNGASTIQLGKTFNLNPTSIWEILERNNIPRRSNLKPCDINAIVSDYRSGQTLQQISQKTSLSAGTILRKLSQENVETRKRKFPLDESLFDTIDLPWKAYFLGLAFADGNVRQLKKGYSFAMALHCKDKEILEALCLKLYGNLIPLKYIPAKDYMSNGVVRKNSHKTMLAIHSKKIVEKFVSYGLVPNKSLTLEWPKNIPEALMGHFLRGYFDGDGWIVLPSHFGIISSQSFCLDAQKFLLNTLGIPSHYHLCNKNGRLLVHKRADATKLYDFLYNDAEIFLKRKRDKFLQMIKRPAV